MNLREEDLEFSFFRSSGPGGQKKNVTDSAVRLRHLPTGLVVISTASRSQHKNKELARQELARRLEARRRKPKPRVATRPSRRAEQRRIDAKKQRGAIKQLRQGPKRDD